MSERAVKILAQLSGCGDGPVIEAALAAEYRRAIEDAAAVCAEKARNYALRASRQRVYGDLEEARFLEATTTAVRDAEASIRALTPELP